MVDVRATWRVPVLGCPAGCAFVLWVHKALFIDPTRLASVVKLICAGQTDRTVKWSKVFAGLTHSGAGIPPMVSGSGKTTFGSPETRPEDGMLHTAPSSCISSSRDGFERYPMGMPQASTATGCFLARLVPSVWRIRHHLIFPSSLNLWVHPHTSM